MGRCLLEKYVLNDDLLCSWDTERKNEMEKIEMLFYDGGNDTAQMMMLLQFLFEGNLLLLLQENFIKLQKVQGEEEENWFYNNQPNIHVDKVFLERLISFICFFSLFLVCISLFLCFFSSFSSCRYDHFFMIISYFLIV